MKKNLILAATVALLTAGTVRSAQTQANTNITNATSPTAATLRTADADSVYSKWTSCRNTRTERSRCGNS